ncbi:MAG: hypothetical protein FJ118_16830 [Deltaproteobacteria bacterium]|nr:hypothetical protein [Deltaproteobacteria bacterium]
MITIFTTPKPFRGDTKVRQYNAIRSWKRLCPEVQALLIGDEEGTDRAAAELGAAHIPDVEGNEYGTPLVSSIFALASEHARYRLLCYVNADIILTGRFIWCAREITQRWSRFLMVGQRWDLDIDRPIDFSRPDWEEELVSEVMAAGKQMSPDGIDYLLFSKGLYRELPRFAVGRAGWDNWMVYRAYSLGAPIVNASAFVTAAHQNHDYSHLPEGIAGVWEGPEALRNRELAGGRYSIFTIEDANFRFSKSGCIERQFIVRRRLRRVVAAAMDFSPSWALKPARKAKELLGKWRKRVWLAGTGSG